MTDLLKLLNSYLHQNHIYETVYCDGEQGGVYMLSVDINWGDWKHDHLAIDHYVYKFFTKQDDYDLISMDTEVTDEDGSDAYSGTHHYKVRASRMEEALDKDERMDVLGQILDEVSDAIRSGQFKEVEAILRYSKKTLLNNKEYKRLITAIKQKFTKEDLTSISVLEEDVVDFDSIRVSDQEFTSAGTSINSSKLPAIFGLVEFLPDTINLDYGGGRFDNATAFLAEKGVTNLVFDPYNRPYDHNKRVLSEVRENGGADTVTCSNVLNVIKERENRLEVIRNIKQLLKLDGVAYFTVYEGDKSGNESPTVKGYQLNQSTDKYIEDISSIFTNVQRKGKLITATN